jgi:rare lipoprotein A
VDNGKEEGRVNARIAMLGLAAALAASGVAAVPVPAAAGEAAGEEAIVFREKGKASYYDDKFQGKKTASGDRFDQAKPVAAHPELPLGSEVTVENPETGKKVEVEVVDRGPHAGGRDIDLSKSAAKAIGITKDGVADVEIRATEPQVEKAIDEPGEVEKVEKQLKKARQEAAADGTKQPTPAPDLEAPSGSGG